MYINNISVNTRQNRPSLLSRTALVTYFTNDGRYVDPYQISAVTIYKSSDNWYPSSVIGEDNVILADSSGSILLNFNNSSTYTSDSSFDPSNYSIGSTGIFRLREGVYAVVIDPSITDYEINLHNLNEGGLSYAPSLSTTGDYLDIWSIVRVAGSELDTAVHGFTMSEDRFISVTEPLMFRVATRLSNRYITLGSIEDLKFTNEFTIENSNIDKSIVNLFKDSLIMNPSVEIYKENTDRNLPARVTVSSMSDTSALCQVTSDNVVLFKLDTTALATHPQLVAGNLGSLTGTYVARLKFQVLDQTLYSNYLAFIIR